MPSEFRMPDAGLEKRRRSVIRSRESIAEAFTWLSIDKLSVLGFLPLTLVPLIGRFVLEAEKCPYRVNWIRFDERSSSYI